MDLSKYYNLSNIHDLFTTSKEIFKLNSKQLEHQFGFWDIYKSNEHSNINYKTLCYLSSQSQNNGYYLMYKNNNKDVLFDIWECSGCNNDNSFIDLVMNILMENVFQLCHMFFVLESSAKNENWDKYYKNWLTSNSKQDNFMK
jgi:hypothetical protein